MTVPPRLAAEWRRRLAAAGFADLETARDADAPLSDRGNLHAVDETPLSREHLGHRAAAGAAHTRWAESVLHTYRFANETDRDIWAAYASGESLKEIGRQLGPGGYHRARETVARVRAAVQVRQVTIPWRKIRITYRARRQARRIDPRLLGAAIAAIRAGRTPAEAVELALRVPEIRDAMGGDE